MFFFNIYACKIYEGLKRGYANFCFHLKSIRHDSNTRRESPSRRTDQKKMKESKLITLDKTYLARTC